MKDINWMRHFNRGSYIIPILFVISLIILGVYVYNFIHMQANIDEVIIAEHACWFSKAGFVKSPLFTGLEQGWHIRQYHYHKLFVLIGSLLLNIFGFSLYTFRILNSLFLIISFYFLWSFISKKPGNNILQFLIMFILLLLNRNYVEHALIYRPETMLMSLGFISFYLLSRSLIQNSKWQLYVSAIFAGLCSFTHLNGLSFVFAGFFFLILKKNYKNAFIFGFIAGIVSLLYFFDITTAQELKSFWHQFSHDPNLSHEDFSWYGPLIKILNEQMRFFWNETMTTFSLVLIISLILFFRSLKKEYNHVLVYFLCLVIGLASIAHGKAVKYGIIYFPYIILIISYTLINLKTIKPVYRIIMIISLSAHFILNINGIVKFQSDSFNSVKRSHEIAKYLKEKDVEVFAYEYFFFNGIKDYNIHGTLAFTIFQESKNNKVFNKDDLFRYTEKLNVTYVIVDSPVINKRMSRVVNFEDLKKGSEIQNYSVIEKNNDFAIFKLNKKETNGS